jgi:hypothetical protein
MLMIRFPFTVVNIQDEAAEEIYSDFASEFAAISHDL